MSPLALEVAEIEEVMMMVTGKVEEDEKRPEWMRAMVEWDY